MTIRRHKGNVVVVLHGDLNDDALARTQRVLTDLVEDQGNLSVAVEFADDVDGQYLEELQQALNSACPATLSGSLLGNQFA